MLRQRQPPFCLRPLGVPKLRTDGGDAVPDFEGEVQHISQGCDWAIGVIGRPHGIATGRAVVQKRRERLRRRWTGTRGYPCHRVYLRES